MNDTVPLRKWRLILIALISITTSQSYAMSQREATSPDSEPRILERLDVGHELPIEIVAVRNLQAERWLRDLEIEIKNISTKPIYEVYFVLSLPNDKHGDGACYGTYLDYGRFALIHPRERASADDKPILPAETVTLTVHEQQWRGYEHHLTIDNPPVSASHNVRLMLVTVNFGDGHRC